MHTEKDTKCPFCKTEYGEVGEETKEKPKDLPAQAWKKPAIKPQKKSFKIWKDN